MKNFKKTNKTLKGKVLQHYAEWFSSTMCLSIEILSMIGKILSQETT